MTKLAAIRARRAQVRARPSKRLPVQAHPDTVAVAYERELVRVVAAQRAAVDRVLGPVLERLEEEQEAVRQDEAIPDLGALIRQARTEFERTITKRTIEGIGQRAGEQLDLFNSRQVERQLGAVLPIDVRASFGSTAEEVGAFTRQGVDLIGSMSSSYFDEVQAQVQAGFEAGRRASSIAKDINRRGEVSESRARFIARDQVSKLNGRLTQKRQGDLGITKYVWRTSGDSRVRSRHRELDGQTFSWDEPPVVDEATGRKEHPGGDYQCRCRAEPDVDSLLDELEAGDVPPAPAEAMDPLPIAAKPSLPELPPILPPPPVPALPMQAPARWAPPAAPKPTMAQLRAQALGEPVPMAMKGGGPAPTFKLPAKPSPTVAELQAKIIATEKRIHEVEAQMAAREQRRKIAALRSKVARAEKKAKAIERELTRPGRTLN